MIYFQTLAVRTSTGIRPVDYYGNFFARTTSDVECAVINAGSSLAVDLKYDDKLPEDEFVIIQVHIKFVIFLDLLITLLFFKNFLDCNFVHLG